MSRRRWLSILGADEMWLNSSLALRSASVATSVVLATTDGSANDAVKGQTALLATPESAVPLEAGHVEAGLLSKTYVGINDWVQLGLHPLLFFVMPHLDVKFSWWSQGSVALASVHQLGYPTPLLRLMAREGTLGLLPANSEVPQALSMAHELRATTTAWSEQSLTASLGFSSALVQDSDEFAVLDFPFLYQRFADLHAPWVLHGGVALEGMLTRRWHYALYSKGWRFTLDEPELSAAVVESSLAAGYQPRADWRISLGLKSSLANYPIGVRLHLLPFLDVRHAF